MSNYPNIHPQTESIVMYILHGHKVMCSSELYESYDYLPDIKISSTREDIRFEAEFMQSL